MGMGKKRRSHPTRGVLPGRPLKTTANSWESTYTVSTRGGDIHLRSLFLEGAPLKKGANPEGVTRG